MINNEINVLISENYNEIPDDILKQTVILRWGFNEEKLDNWVNNMRRDSFGFTSFYVFALTNNNVIGFAYFCQNETNESQWYYGDLIIHTEHRRSGVATKIIEHGIQYLKKKNASKLFTYVDKNNNSSIALHEKLSFSISESQEPINGFNKIDRTIYEFRI